MRTARSSSHHGGESPHTPLEQAPLEQAPPGAGTPLEQAPPGAESPPGLGLETPLGQIPLNFPLGCKYEVNMKKEIKSLFS